MDKTFNRFKSAMKRAIKGKGRRYLYVLADSTLLVSNGEALVDCSLYSPELRTLLHHELLLYSKGNLNGPLDATDQLEDLATKWGGDKFKSFEITRLRWDADINGNTVTYRVLHTVEGDAETVIVKEEYIELFRTFLGPTPFTIDQAINKSGPKPLRIVLPSGDVVGYVMPGTLTKETQLTDVLKRTLAGLPV